MADRIRAEFLRRVGLGDVLTPAIRGGLIRLPEFPTASARALRPNGIHRRTLMPFANIKLPEGVADAARKEEIIHRVTDMFVEYFGERSRPYTMVLVDEVADGGWGRADETLTLAKMGLPPRAR